MNLYKIIDLRNYNELAFVKANSHVEALTNYLKSYPEMKPFKFKVKTTIFDENGVYDGSELEDE